MMKLNYLILFFKLYLSVVAGELDVVWAQAIRVDHDLIWEAVLPSEDYFIIGQFFNRSKLESKTKNPRIPEQEWEKRIPVARSSGNELSAPLYFTKIDIKHDNLFFWRMECPQHYVALSGIGTRRGQGQPDTARFRCVHENFTQTQRLYFHILGNGYAAIWPHSIDGNLVGSFYTITKPSKNHQYTAFGYQLTVQPRTLPLFQNVSSTTRSSTRPFTVLPRTQPPITSPHNSSLSDYTTTTTTTNNRDYLMVLVSAVVIASSLIASALLLLCCLRFRRDTQALKTQMEQTNNDPEFVFKCGTATIYSGNKSVMRYPLNHDRETRINMLYNNMQALQ